MALLGRLPANDTAVNPVIPTTTRSLVWPPAILLFFFLATSFYGLNFGVHWDETRAKFDSVRDSIVTGVFMQASADPEGKNYNHGGLNYLLTWSGFTPEILSYLRTGPRTREALSARITPLIYTPQIRIRVRAIYVILCGFSIVWLYCLSIVLGRGRLEAFWAAAILSCSWEIAYHSRWIAPDALMMQFALLSFLCLAIGSEWKKTGWFYAGAVALGLAVGAKYPAAIAVPFFLAAVAYAVGRTSRLPVTVLKHVLALGAVIACVFIATTPGVILDPFRFFGQLQEQHDIYSTSWYGYTVQPGLHHFLDMLTYFALQLFSHYWSMSIALAAFCAFGLVYVIADRKLAAVTMFLFSVTYLVFFSQQAAMIVRNLLVVVPFLCLAAARGITAIAAQFNRNRRIIVYAFVGLILSINLGWEIYAARQIKLRAHSEYFLKRFAVYARTQQNDTFFVSRKLANALGAVESLPGNLVTKPNAAYTKVAFLQSEGADRFWEQNYPSNWWGLYERNFGALEVNLDAYSTFVGNERILVMSRKNFSKLPMTEKDLY